MLPSATVAVLGYVSLRQWERSAEALFREQARDVAAMAADKLAMMLRRADDDLLASLSRALAAGVSRPVLDRFRADTPLLERLYLTDPRGRLVYSAGWSDEEAAGLAAALAEAGPALLERGGRTERMVGDVPVLLAAVPGPAGPLLAALTRSPDTVRRQVLEKTLEGLGGPTICAVVDDAGRPIWAAGPLEAAELVAAVPLGAGPPTWRVAIYQPRAGSPAAAVRRQTMIFTFALVTLTAVIAAGVVATWRLVRRETEMAQLKADFVANVSHDLKTPLSVIRMFGETLEMGRLRDEAARQEYYRVITRESERLSRLIDNVLDFSRIERGRRRYDRQPTAVEPLVRDTLEAFAYPLAQQGFKVDVAVAPDLPLVALDREAVSQALANLIDNAIKYSAERKVVGVEARVADGHLTLTVADEGIGIPPAEHARIFEKFYRVGRSETQSRRGSGVGLALVRHVAEAHGGRVTVESRPGAGSRFTLWLPLSPV